MPKKYKVIGMGGSFDHFHAGHQAFLRFAASVSNEIWVGIATDTLTRHKAFQGSLESYAVRSQNVSEFLDAEQIPSRIFPLNDPCGPTLEGSPVEAIVVTDVTKQGGEFINQCRVNLRLPALPIEICEMLKDEFGEHLSSTNIRAGQVSRTGTVYRKLFDQDIVLTPEQKTFFQKRHGQVVLSPTTPGTFTYVVGDMVLETFLINRWAYQFGVFDGFNQRQNYDSSHVAQLTETAAATNPAGKITKELANQLMAVQNQLMSALETNQAGPLHLRVHGEEDLAAVVLGLLAPLGTVIYYGQPNEGIIEMLVTETLKTNFYQNLQLNRVEISSARLTGLTSLAGVTDVT